MATTYGIDLTTATSRATGYTGYFDTPIYVVGSNLQPHKFSEAEFQLTRPLRTNEGIRLAYRTDESETFTTIITVDFTTYGAKVSHNIVVDLPYEIKACEQIEFRVSLTGTTTTPYFKFLRLK